MVDTQQREFVTARAAADLLGVPESVIVSDIKRGIDHIDGLIGGRFGETWIVYAWQLADGHLQAHRERLSVTSTAVRCTWCGSNPDECPRASGECMHAVKDAAAPSTNSPEISSKLVIESRENVVL